MLRDDDLPEKKAKAYVVGQDVNAYSIVDLEAEILRLGIEIERLSAVREAKRATQSAADALFRKQ